MSKEDKEKTTVEKTDGSKSEPVAVAEEPVKKAPRLKPVYREGLGFRTIIGYINVETGEKKMVVNKRR